MTDRVIPRLSRGFWPHTTVTTEKFLGPVSSTAAFHSRRRATENIKMGVQGLWVVRQLVGLGVYYFSYTNHRS